MLNSWATQVSPLPALKTYYKAVITQTCGTCTRTGRIDTSINLTVRYNCESITNYTFMAKWFLFLLLSRLCTQRGAWTHNPKIKSCMLYWLNKPETSGPSIFEKSQDQSIRCRPSFWNMALEQLDIHIWKREVRLLRHIKRSIQDVSET